MADNEIEGGASREEIVQRIELMESMVAEGRRFTARCGWIFVLWGVVDLAAMSWRYFQPDSRWVGAWAWPICLVAGAALTLLGRALQGRRQNCVRGLRCRSVEAVWAMMGISLAIYVAGAMVRHLTWQYSYVAGLLIIIGMAHAISAVILRWRVQGLVAAVWWAGAIAAFCVRSNAGVQRIMFVEMVFGMILFGLYAMALERTSGGRANEDV
ncbi:MAG: hypothetical protein ABSA85_00100 [Terracidiphilus sp.]|jgi:hypothetical protein